MAIKLLVWSVSIPWVFALQIAPAMELSSAIQVTTYHSLLIEANVSHEQTVSKKESLSDGQQLAHVISQEVLSYVYPSPVIRVKDVLPEVEPRAAPTFS